MNFKGVLRKVKITATILSYSYKQKQQKRRIDPGPSIKIHHFRDTTLHNLVVIKTKINHYISDRHNIHILIIYY